MPDSSHVYIIDRKKNFFKLQNGQFVAPTRLEKIFCAEISDIKHIFIHGTSEFSFLVAVIQPQDDSNLDAKVQNDSLNTILQHFDSSCRHLFKN